MDCDVIIVGGGLVGASLALALRAARLRVALVEAHVFEATSARHLLGPANLCDQSR